MKPGDKFTAVRKNGSPVTRRKFANSEVRVLSEFTFIELRRAFADGETIEWYDCEIKGHSLRDSGKLPRYYQLFTKFFEFYKVA